MNLNANQFSVDYLHDLLKMFKIQRFWLLIFDKMWEKGIFKRKLQVSQLDIHKENEIDPHLYLIPYLKLIPDGLNWEKYKI